MLAFRKSAVVFGMAGAFCFLANDAVAGVFGGTLQSVSTTSKRIVVQATSAKVNRVFRATRSTRVTLDSKPASLSKLKPGYQVSVFTSSSGAVTRITARSATARPTPSKTASKKPKSVASTSPVPRSSPNSTPKSSSTGRPQVGSAEKTTGWTQFRGPNRDNISSETGLLKSWPNGAPPKLWTSPNVGEGFSSVAIADGKVFTMGNLGNTEVIFALDLETGRELWKANNGSGFRDGNGNGPRGTPTVDGDRVYALGASGVLTCLDAASGQARWQKNILQQFGGRRPGWGICESVLIDGDRLICTPGGRDATMVALNKNTGNVVWRSSVPGSPSAAYSSPIVAEVGGVRQYVNFTSSAVIGVRAADGTFMWADNSSANGTANCSTPVFYRDHVFSASGYGKGGALVRLTSSGNRTMARPVYPTNNMKNHHGGMVVIDGYLYGSNDPGILTCLELQSGKVAWQNRSVGKGSLVYADGHLYVRSEGGQVALIAASPNGYQEKGRFNQPERSNRNAWAHPVIADGKLFLRDMNNLLCFNVRAGG